MTRAQINQLDALPDGTPMSAEIIGRDGATTAAVTAGILIQRTPALGSRGTWAVGFAGDDRRVALLSIRECNRVEIGEGRITVRH
jgi:hypothetical protein